MSELFPGLYHVLIEICTNNRFRDCYLLLWFNRLTQKRGESARILTPQGFFTLSIVFLFIVLFDFLLSCDRMFIDYFLVFCSSLKIH
jgi:hypothetical protein